MEVKRIATENEIDDFGYEASFGVYSITIGHWHAQWLKQLLYAALHNARMYAEFQKPGTEDAVMLEYNRECIQELIKQLEGAGIAYSDKEDLQTGMRLS